MFEVGDKVTYNGDKRDSLFDLVGVVEKASREAGLATAVRFPDNEKQYWHMHVDSKGLVWAADWAWCLVEPVNSEDNVNEQPVFDNTLFATHSASIDALKNEKDRLSKRIAEIDVAIKVLETL